MESERGDYNRRVPLTDKHTGLLVVFGNSFSKSNLSVAPQGSLGASNIWPAAGQTLLASITFSTSRNHLNPCWLWRAWGIACLFLLRLKGLKIEKWALQNVSSNKCFATAVHKRCQRSVRCRLIYLALNPRNWRKDNKTNAYEFRNVTENWFSDRLTVGECTKIICDIKKREGKRHFCFCFNLSMWGKKEFKDKYLHTYIYQTTYMLIPTYLKKNYIVRYIWASCWAKNVSFFHFYCENVRSVTIITV